jgi:hypothetical protein
MQEACPLICGSTANPVCRTSHKDWSANAKSKMYKKRSMNGYFSEVNVKVPFFMFWSQYLETVDLTVGFKTVVQTLLFI